jgi:hypothetical protein
LPSIQLSASSILTLFELPAILGKLGAARPVQFATCAAAPQMSEKFRKLGSEVYVDAATVKESNRAL